MIAGPFAPRHRQRYLGARLCVPGVRRAGNSQPARGGNRAPAGDRSWSRV